MLNRIYKIIKMDNEIIIFNSGLDFSHYYILRAVYDL